MLHVNDDGTMHKRRCWSLFDNLRKLQKIGISEFIGLEKFITTGSWGVTVAVAIERDKVGPLMPFSAPNFEGIFWCNATVKVEY